MKKILINFIFPALLLISCSKDKEQSNVKWSFSVQTDKDSLQRLEIKDTVLITSVIKREYKIGAEMFYKVVIGEKTKSDEYELLDEHDLTIGNGFRKLDSDTLKVKFIGLKKRNYNLTIVLKNSKKFRVEKNYFFQYDSNEKNILTQDVVTQFIGRIEKHNKRIEKVFTCVRFEPLRNDENRMHCAEYKSIDTELYDIYLGELLFKPPLKIKITGNDGLKKITIMKINIENSSDYKSMKEYIADNLWSLNYKIIKDFSYNGEKELIINKINYNDYIHRVLYNETRPINDYVYIKQKNDDTNKKEHSKFLWLEIETIRGKKEYVKLPEGDNQQFYY